MAKSSFYAYYMVEEQTRGIVESWDECAAATAGRNARYRGFSSREEAVRWLDGGAVYEDRKARKAGLRQELPQDAIYFDSGTGRGAGTEVNVTDREGTPMAFMAAPADVITEFGTVRLTPGRTNNYGELMGCYLAMKIAMKQGIKTVCGDSRLVLDYWSRGRVSADAVAQDADLALLARRTAELRRMYEAAGGVLIHVPGGVNPADLGFHRD